MRNRIREILDISQETELKMRFSKVEFLCNDGRLVYDSAMISRSKRTLHGPSKKALPPNMVHMFSLLIFYITSKVTYLFDLFLGLI